MLLIVHSIKGEAANFGIEELSEKAAKYESELRTMGIITTSALQKDFCDSFDSIISILGAYFVKEGDSADKLLSGETETIDGNEASKTLVSVLGLLDEDGYEADKLLLKNMAYIFEKTRAG